MKTGSTGTFVISWSQTELEGLVSAPVSAVSVGATWRWTGTATCVDGAGDILVLEGALGADELRARAARNVRRLLGLALDTATDTDVLDETGGLFDGAFDVTDGRARYTLTLIDLPQMRVPLLMFIGAPPPRDRDLWIVSHQTGLMNRDTGGASEGAVICFTPGTRIATETGSRAVEDLRPGDRVLTKDNGPQPLGWIGSRHISGGRLYAMPHLRPIRLRPGALGPDVPDAELVVSPAHRLLVRGRAAQDLFGVSEVLARAGDLVDGRLIAVDRRMRDVRYIHLMLEQHQILFANGVETESFHPEGADLSALPNAQRARLDEAFPWLAAGASAYGAPARRLLSGGEAAILRHKAA